jgi:hypothetical protein
MRGRLRQSALVSPRLKVHVPDGQAVVDGFDIVGENIAVSHLVQVSRNGVGRAESRRRSWSRSW